MKIKTKFVLVSLFLGFIISCQKTVTKNGELKGSIEVAGSSTVYPITTAVAEEFIKLYPKVNIPIRSTGTGGGFKNFFISGKTDINDASRKMKSSEVLSAKKNGITAYEFQVGIDAITIVVNPKSFVSGLTVKELSQIWKAENPAKLWSQVNPKWPNNKIELYGPSSASGTFDYFTKKINGEEGSSRADYQKTEQDNTIVQAVYGSQFALGYFGLAYYLENKTKVKAVKINGIMPSLENARSGIYQPLSRPIFIYVSSKSLQRKEVREFVRFYLKLTATDLIREVGYVPVTQKIMEANLNKLEEIISNVK